MTGPAVQDLWMLLSGRPEEMRAQLDDIVEGYQEFADFDQHEAALIEPLRTLRALLRWRLRRAQTRAAASLACALGHPRVSLPGRLQHVRGARWDGVVWGGGVR